MEKIMGRVELHEATTREQYRGFHEGMAKFGLDRTITSNGATYYLPTGEYLGENPDRLELLGRNINLLALQITGHPCKLVLAPVNPTRIYTLGLECPSFAEELASTGFPAGSRS